MSYEPISMRRRNEQDVYKNTIFIRPCAFFSVYSGGPVVLLEQLEEDGPVRLVAPV